MVRLMLDITDSGAIEKRLAVLHKYAPVPIDYSTSQAIVFRLAILSDEEFETHIAHYFKEDTK